MFTEHFTNKDKIFCLINELKKKKQCIQQDKVINKNALLYLLSPEDSD